MKFKTISAWFLGALTAGGFGVLALYMLQPELVSKTWAFRGALIGIMAAAMNGTPVPWLAARLMPTPKDPPDAKS